jgi:hypothetical protein
MEKKCTEIPTNRYILYFGNTKSLIMKQTVYSKANKIWKSLHKEIDESKIELDINFNKKILDIFHVGHYYYFIFNIKKGAFDLVSDELTSLLGYSKIEYSVPFLLQRIHPVSIPFLLQV